MKRDTTVIGVPGVILDCLSIRHNFRERCNVSSCSKNVRLVAFRRSKADNQSLSEGYEWDDCFQFLIQ